MHARLTTWRVGAENRPKMERLADGVSQQLRGMAGFRSITFLGDDAAGEYSSLAVWESKQAAEAAMQAFASQMRQIVADFGVQPEVRTFEVYEPRA